MCVCVCVCAYVCVCVCACMLVCDVFVLVGCAHLHMYSMYNSELRMCYDV